VQAGGSAFWQPRMSAPIAVTCRHSSDSPSGRARSVQHALAAASVMVEITGLVVTR
jgi:hypothetical protein